MLWTRKLFKLSLVVSLLAISGIAIAQQDKMITFDDLMQETMTQLNNRDNYIIDSRSPASDSRDPASVSRRPAALPEATPVLFPDILPKPTKVVNNFVVPQLDVPFSAFNDAPPGAAFTYNFQAPW